MGGVGGGVMEREGDEGRAGHTRQGASRSSPVRCPVELAVVVEVCAERAAQATYGC